jgi:arsenite methyltransferase
VISNAKLQGLNMSSRVNYGLDSPAIIAGLCILSALSFSVTVMLHLLHAAHVFLEIGSSIIGIYFMLGACGMVRYSKVGKLRIRDQILEQVPWRGNEMVLDVGCGRGLLLVAAAHRLTTGKAIGVDRWIPGALTGNHPQAALDNARLEGVLDSVELRQGDVRQLPFADKSIDVALSNFVLHEVNTSAEREQMLREICRVLKPGGRLALVDLIFTDQCARMLGEMGIKEVKRIRVGSFFSFWITAILNFGLAQTYLVTGRKPYKGPSS